MEAEFLTFDCYGTLIDWRAGIERALQEVFGTLPTSGKELLDAYVDAEAKEESAYKKYRDVLAAAAKRLSVRYSLPWDAEKGAKFAESVPRWPAFPDTREALKRLGGMGAKRYILSNVDTDLLEKTVDAWGLEVDGVVTAEQVGSYKPAEGHWRAFFERTSAPRNKVLHVAQSVYHDILPAERMGLSSVWVNRYAEPLPPKAHPDYIVASLRDVEGLLSP